MKDMLAHFKDFCKEAAECERIAKVATSTRSLKPRRVPPHNPAMVTSAIGLGVRQAIARDPPREFVIVIYGM
jgi:hypothetical protein